VTGSRVGWGMAGRVALSTAPKDNVVPTRYQTLLLVGCPRRFYLWSGRKAGCTATLTAFGMRPLSKRRLSFLSFHAALVVGCVVSSTYDPSPFILVAAHLCHSQGICTPNLKTC
jgi:hypothetical protein